MTTNNTKNQNRAEAQATLEPTTIKTYVLSEEEIARRYGKPNKVQAQPTEPTTAEQDNGYANLLRKFEKDYREHIANPTRQTDDVLGKSLQDLAVAVVYSVCKKLRNVGGAVTEDSKNKNYFNLAIANLSRQLSADLDHLSRLEILVRETSKLILNQDGYYERVITDKDGYEAITKEIDKCISESMDLVQDAIVKILEETYKSPCLGEFLEEEYNITRLKKKVRIKQDDSQAFETVTTKPILETYRKVRQSVSDARQMQVASHVYTYIDSVITNPETGEETTVYERLDKYTTATSEIKDFNGKTTAMVADGQTKEDINNIISNLKLSPVQTTVLSLRLRGYGYKAIATYLGIRVDNVKTQVKRIQQKWIAVGYVDPTSKQ